MINKDDDRLLIHVNIRISAATLQAIVANAKKTAPAGPDGRYRVDTADKVSELISRFLEEKDFDGFARNLDNFRMSTD